MTFGEFKNSLNDTNAAFYIMAAAEIKGRYNSTLCKQGHAMYGNCDDFEVASWTRDDVSGIYTVWLKNAKIG